ncbi:MAG: DUF4114 domain-containing protein [Enterovibrio sp.]
MKFFLKPVVFSLMLISGMASGASVVVDVPTVTNNPTDSTFMQIATEGVQSNKPNSADFLNANYSPELTLNTDSTVYVTFLASLAGYKNTLGYITYNNDSFLGMTKSNIDLDGNGVIGLDELNAIPSVSTGFLFSNTSQAKNNNLYGDTVQITDGLLSKGTKIAFFLGQDTGISSSRDNLVSNGIFTGRDDVFYGLDFLNPESSNGSTINSRDEYTRHSALFFSDSSKENVILGFEDLLMGPRNPSDNDFNDGLFLITSGSSGAFNGSNIATAPLSPMEKSLFGIAFLSIIFVFSRRDNANNTNPIF